MPDNAVLVPWLSYSKTMPHCDVAILHGGHGTLVRALTEGCIPIVCPAAGDQYENAARIDWAGLGVRFPRRLLSPASVRLAVRRALAQPKLRERVSLLASSPAVLDAPSTTARVLEQWAEHQQRG